MREVVVYRHNLFRISEPFITQQAGRLRRFKPLYLGRFRYGSAPPGTESLALEDLTGLGRFHRLARQVIARDPRSYLRLLSGRRPALIHAHFGIEGVYALPLAERLGVPLVTTFHGFDATLSSAAMLCSPAWANYPLFRRRLARQGDLFLCVSSFIRDRVLAQGFPEERTHVHYIGIDTAAIQPREPGGEPLTILNVARLVQVKGTEYLIRAFAKLAPRTPPAELVIIGEGPLERRLRALARSLGVGETVRFLGALPHAEVMAWMGKAAIFVLPSVRTRTGRTEGGPMVLLEAAAAGVPAVGTRHGGIPEIITDGQSGYLVAERDSDELAARMGELLAHATQRAWMGRRARELVETRFDIHKQTERLEGFYDRVLSGR
ncbi:MAG: glycosyl transferase [Chromatiales bacterium 21-64-14]|nr:MAG: glycosyl transferase [Chromatiales bacterium 21-64-14]HQU15604.1 glycosyltransferase [Gammaproteobacteria bacterium]